MLIILFQMFQYFNCEQQLKAWIACPNQLLQLTVNVFGEELDLADDVASLQPFMTGEVELQLEALSAVLQSILTVLQRQLKGFLSEEQLPTEVVMKVSSAPTHNMASERALGCLDKMMRRAPVATSGFLDGKVRSKLNKSTQWLDSKPPDSQEQIVSFAIKEARHLRLRKMEMDRDVEREIDRRRSEVASERRQKKKKSASKAVAKAIKHNSASELDCCESIKDRISKFVDKDSFIGTAFVHTIDSTDFYGRVNSMEKYRFVIGYWGLMESESGSVDHSVEVVALFADAILGSVVFM